MNVLVPGQNGEHQVIDLVFLKFHPLIFTLILVLAALVCFATMSVTALRKNGLV